MKAKQFIVFISMMLLTGVSLTNPIVVKAEGLTQAVDSSYVNYGELSKTDIQIIKSFFDYKYYRDTNSDVVEVLGDNKSKLFNHFCKCGIFEGRVCNPDFDPSAYASAYSDLRERYGDNFINYYKHYLRFGKKEKRNFTTVKKCVDAGITVEGLVGKNTRITPTVYALAEMIGTNDYETVQNALNSLMISGTSSGGSSSNEDSSSNSSNSSNTNYNDKTITAVIENKYGEKYLIVNAAGDNDAYEKAKGLTKVGEISAGNRRFNAYLLKGNTGYALKQKNGDIYNTLYQTQDYTQNSWGDSYGESIAVIDLNWSSTATDSFAFFIAKKKAEETNKYGEPNEPYYKNYVNNELTTDYNGVTISANPVPSGNAIARGWYTNAIECESTATNYYKNESYTEIAGYYDENRLAHEFNSEEEKNEYIADKGDASLNERKNEEAAFGAIDVKGDVSTVYDVGFELVENDAGGIESISVSVSNDENEFGYVCTSTDIEMKN